MFTYEKLAVVNRQARIAVGGWQLVWYCRRNTSRQFRGCSFTVVSRTQSAFAAVNIYKLIGENTGSCSGKRCSYTCWTPPQRTEYGTSPRLQRPPGCKKDI